MSITTPDVWDDIYRNGYVYGTKPSEAIVKAQAYLASKNWFDQEGTFIELGCGNGRDLVEIAQSYKIAIGVDVSPQAIKFAQQHIRLIHSSKEIKLITNNALKYLETKDFIFHNRIYFYTHYFLQVLNQEKREQLLSRLYIVSPPGTVFIFSEYSNKDHRFGQGEEVEHGSYRLYPDRPEHAIHFFTRDEMISIAKHLCTDILLLNEYIENETVGGKFISSTTWLCVLRRL